MALMLLDFLVIWIFGTILMVKLLSDYQHMDRFQRKFNIVQHIFCMKNFFILYSTLWLVSFTNSKKKHDLDKFKILFSTPMLHAFTFKSTHLFLMLAFSIKINMQHTKTRVHISNSSHLIPYNVISLTLSCLLHLDYSISMISV